MKLFSVASVWDSPLRLTLTITFAVIVTVVWVARWLTTDFEKKEQKRYQADLVALFTKNASVKASGATPPLTALVTGANSGIGAALAEGLAATGMRVILGCRSKDRATAAVAKILSRVPAADLHILIIDVAEPQSVLTAVKQLRAGGEFNGLTLPQITHLDYLFCNAGIMPNAFHRWNVALWATLTCNLRFFFEVGRSSPTSHHFVAQPEDDVLTAGAPSVFATHVLGHMLLIEECRDLLQPLTQHGGTTTPSPETAEWEEGRGGRIIWTGSRAASAKFLNWDHIEPPAHLGAESGYVRWQRDKRSHAESYGEAKHAVDLLSAAIPRVYHVPSLVICPGAVDTELTPGILKAVVPVMTSFRYFLRGFNCTPARGSHALLAAAAAPVDTLRADTKYIAWAGELMPSPVGTFPRPIEDQTRMVHTIQQWLKVWRAAAAATQPSFS